MLTNEEANYLLDLEKTLVDPNQVIDLSKKKNRLDLFSQKEPDYNFWLEITTNQKIILKTSIHHLESNSFIGLFVRPSKFPLDSFRVQTRKKSQ